MAELTKWYLDLVTDAGEVWIGYCARFRHGRLTLHYASTLSLGEDDRPRTRSSLRRGEWPERSGTRVRWSGAPGAAGEWDALAAPVEQRLLETPRGLVHWECFQPRARAQVTLGRGAKARVLEGLGYVERLTVTLPPWDMQLSELRWGRALSPTGSCVWIDWRGSHRGAWVFGEAGEERLVSVDEHAVQLGSGARVELKDNRTLRAGKIGSTALELLPRAALGTAARALAIDEQKWRARADFPDGSQGWAIHEIVRWP